MADNRDKWTHTQWAGRLQEVLAWGGAVLGTVAHSNLTLEQLYEHPVLAEVRGHLTTCTEGCQQVVGDFVEAARREPLVKTA